MWRSLVAAFFGLLICALPARPAALAPNKTSDDSVCDLGPNTTELLGRGIWVPTEPAMEVQAEAYVRLASKFIAGNCGQGQLLILHSPDSSRLDASTLPEVANRLCRVADVTRVPTTSRSRVGDEEEQGFELRCRISKFDAFKTVYEQNEKTEATSDFIARLQKRADPTAVTGPGRVEKKDCGKMTLSSILAGGACP